MSYFPIFVILSPVDLQINSAIKQSQMLPNPKRISTPPHEILVYPFLTRKIYVQPVFYVPILVTPSEFCKKTRLAYWENENDQATIRRRAEESVMVSQAISAQCRSVTDGWTDRRTEC